MRVNPATPEPPAPTPSATTCPTPRAGCAVCGDACAAPLASVPEGQHLWFVPREHGFPNISGDAESCAACGKMRGPVNESRPCPGVAKMQLEDWFR